MNPVFYTAALILLLGSLISCSNPAEHRIKVILDADTANEVDDLFALVSAAMEPSFDLLTINAAQFHTSPLASDTSMLESHAINEDLLRLLDRADIPLQRGSPMPLTSLDSAQSSEASRFIINQARQMSNGDTLHIVVLGPCTNVASALIEAPDIVDRIAVHYLGFWHDPRTNVYDIQEFNTGNDTLAVQLLLEHPDLDLTVMSATTSQRLVFDKNDVDQRLKDRNALGDYLVQRWESYERWWTREDSLKTQWIMWDVAIVEALANPDLAQKSEYLSPPKFTQRSISIYDTINVAGIKHQYWDKLSALE